MKAVKAVLFILIFAANPLFAWFDTGKAGLPGEYLYMFSGNARGLGLGLAQTALSGSANMAYSNPASLADLWWQEFGYTYVPLFAGTQFSNASYGYPVSKNNVIGVSITTLTSGDAEKTNELGESIGTFSDRQSCMMLSYAGKLTPKLHMGVNAKFVTQDIDTNNQKSIGFDAGLLYKYVPYHYWAISFINLVQPQLGTDIFPVITRIGFWHGFFANKLGLTTDVSIYNLFGNSTSTSDPSWFYGLEYAYTDWLNLRLGANNQQFSSGFGVKMRHVDFDYAFVYHPLDFIHTFTVNVRFGFQPTEAEIKVRESMDDLSLQRSDYLKRKNFEDERMKGESKKLKLQIKLTMDFNKAWGLYNQEQYEQSKTILESIVKQDPNFEEAKKLLLEIQSRLDTKIVERKYLEAKKAYEKGYYSDAEESVDYALKIDSSHQDANVLKHLIRARILLSHQQYNEAKTELIELLQISPDNGEGMELLKRLQNIIEINK
jgi:tetratricopeptide (TPR) repeat protein